MKQLLYATKALFICWLGMSVMVFSYIEIDDSISQNLGYENTIVALQEFTTMQSCKLILTFEHDDPICMYAPQNFSESVHHTLYRIYMPRTTIAEGVSSSYAMEQDGDGVELLLTGTSLKKFISGNIVVFVLGT